jgi:hypothetical protein
VERLATGEQVRTNILADGTQSEVHNATDGPFFERNANGEQASA